MDAKKLIELRKEAEKAVADMPDGDLKVKAFEVLLSHLISTSRVPQQPTATSASSEKREQGATTEDLPAESVAGRIMVLREEGFLKSPKTLAEIREELQSHGWHYPNATIAPVLITLVQKKRLRRQRVQDAKRKLWKYTNP